MTMSTRRLLLRLPATAMVCLLAAAGCTSVHGKGSPAGHSAPPAASLAIYPTANSRTASPRTSISLRGLDTASIGHIEVRGSRSGSHSGRFRADSDGKGESFYPDRPFAAGEQVTVTATHPLVGSTARQHTRITFTVSRPVDDPITPAPAEYNNPASESHFVSAPQLNAPVVRVVKGSLDPSGGDLFLAPRGGSGGDGPMIVKPDGTLVWYKPYPPGYMVYDFRTQTYRGHRVLTWFRGFPASSHGRGADVIYDTSYHRIAGVKAGNGYAADHHEFQITPWNTALITIYQPVHWDLRSVGGPADGIVNDGIFQEIDIPTGNVLAEWHSLDRVPLSDSFRRPQAGTTLDYFHINSLDSRRRGYVLVSSRMTHTIYDVEEQTGRVLWRLGGMHSSFTGNANDFSSQHDAKFLDATHISVFDNGGGVGPKLHQHSRAVVVRFDFSTRTATLVSDDQGLDFPFVPTQGNTQVLPNGHVFVGWAGRGFASEFDRTGKEIYRSALPDSDQTYREYRFRWHGAPTSVPAVVASASKSATRVWASWNGATEVSAWRLLTGNNPSRLRALGGTHPGSSFETAMTVSGAPAYVAVQALRADGSVLATSHVTAVKQG
jgi:hypothetical protein